MARIVLFETRNNEFRIAKTFKRRDFRFVDRRKCQCPPKSRSLALGGGVDIGRNPRNSKKNPDSQIIFLYSLFAPDINQ